MHKMHTSNVQVSFFFYLFVAYTLQQITRQLIGDNHVQSTVT